MKTRFAPSPTGYLHIGGLRTALYSWLYAKRKGGKFVLRIEDTDRERYVEGAIDLIYRTLKDAGLYYDEGPDVGGPNGPYIQSERMVMYKEYAHELVKKGKAYYCFCTKERLDSMREADPTFKYDKHCKHLSNEEIEENIKNGVPYVIRQDMPNEGEISYEDLVFGKVSVPASDLDDNILLKSDGMPTYNFANVVDDHLMGITHIIRGSEYLSSTPKYNLLYEAFGWEIPSYMHLPPVMKDAQHKLSKRNGDASYEDLLAKGYLKEAIINYIALLGWSPGDNQEIFSLDELVYAFDVKGINKSPAIFDEAKLRWMNAEYIRLMSKEKFLQICEPYFEQVFGDKEFDKDILAEILQPRLEVLTDIPQKVGFLVEFGNYDPELFLHKKMKTNFEIAKNSIAYAISGLNNVDWTHDAIYDYLVNIAETIGYKKGQFLFSIRIAITGVAVTPGGAIEAALLLGKEETLRRLNYSLDILSLRK
ncbi:MAG: glutamate--tRNA ligase [Lachnospiraceae bacterium]|nr:glutamate--tRNA ligase [Lachnospiraceae bacterium]